MAAKAAREMRSERTAQEVVEEAREKEWVKPSFVLDLFMGKPRLRDLLPFPQSRPEERAHGEAFLSKLKTFLDTRVDGDEIDRTGQIPQDVMEGLAFLGAFGMTIPRQYGGLGLSNFYYNRAISIVSGRCASTAVLLSAHQSIGVPKPLLLFGTEEQKRKYLPRLAKGAISAFALTEPDVGSDPARMTTTAVLSEDGSEYILNGTKLWCTNGVIADLLVVMAQTPLIERGREVRKITAFIVEVGRDGTPGLEVVHRCQFMGLRGIQNGVLKFNHVRVPRENVIWAPGRGLHLALATLNAGRLSLPAGALGVAKRCLSISKAWAGERVQWGVPIGQHEAIGNKIARMHADFFAIDSMVGLVSQWVDSGARDIRLESAMAKIFGSERSFEIIDETFQIRGGRGYETAESLAARGEEAVPIERFYRDARINKVIEGTSEVLRLFVVREGLDKHLKIAGDIFNKKLPWGRRARAAFKAALFYAGWYPRQWIPRELFPAYADMGRFAPYFRFVSATSRRLARTSFHLMARHGPALEKRQNQLLRLADISTGLFAMSAVMSRALSSPEADESFSSAQLIQESAELFCLRMAREIEGKFQAIQANSDSEEKRLSRQLMAS
jgi:alkylation response protein AidB-like acyl-CoA dehydrogenase